MLPPRLLAFKFATWVVLATMSGAVPVEIEDCNCGAANVFVLTMGLVVVPAIAGHVRFAVPLAEPYPVMTQAVVRLTPQVSEFVLNPVTIGDVAKTTLPLPVAPAAVTPPMEMFAPKVCRALNVSVVPNAATVSLAAGNVNLVLSVPANSRVLSIWSLLEAVPPAMLKPVELAVRLRPFTLVAVATPRLGVVIEHEAVKQRTVPIPLVVSHVIDVPPPPPLAKMLPELPAVVGRLKL